MNEKSNVESSTATIPEPTFVEHCRECRDTLPYGSKLPAADFILWGKFFPALAFGPKCYFHASKWFDISRLDQYAVYDLRPAHALVNSRADA